MTHSAQQSTTLRPSIVLLSKHTHVHISGFIYVKQRRLASDCLLMSSCLSPVNQALVPDVEAAKREAAAAAREADVADR